MPRDGFARRSYSRSSKLGVGTSTAAPATLSHTPTHKISGLKYPLCWVAWQKKGAERPEWDGLTGVGHPIFVSTPRSIRTEAEALAARERFQFIRRRALNWLIRNRLTVGLLIWFDIRGTRPLIDLTLREKRADRFIVLMLQII